MNKPQETYGLMFTEFLKDGLTNSNYEVWYPHRKVIGRCFTYNALQQYLKIENKHAITFGIKLSLLADTDGVVKAPQVHDEKLLRILMR